MHNAMIEMFSNIYIYIQTKRTRIFNAVTETKPYYVTAKQTFNYAIYTKHVNFKLYSINVTVVNILFINKSPEE